MEKNINQDRFLSYFFYGLIIIFVILAFIFDDINSIISGLVAIITTKEILLTDYFEIGSIGGALINTSLVTTITLIILKINKIKINALGFAALFSLIGFSFFGKNIYNILPIYLGVYFYSLYSNEPFKKFFLLAVFSTCLAPLIGYNFLENTLGIFLGISIGIVYGFVIVPLSSHVMKFHNGYTLYNVGFAGGLFALVTSSVLRTFGIELETVNIISTKYHTILITIIIVLCLLFFIFSFLVGPLKLSQFNELTKKSGRAVTDYFLLFDMSTVFFNIALMGLISLSSVMLFNVTLNGPIFGAILTAMGFSAFGLNPRNALVVIAGCIFMLKVSNSPMNSDSILTVLFVVGLAPIAGRYGVFAGFLAGMLHFSVVNFSASWQGAINLYNNGFASGIVAALLVNIIDNLRRGD